MSDKKEVEKNKDATSRSTRRYEKSIEAASFLGGVTVAVLVLLITPASQGNIQGDVFCSNLKQVNGTNFCKV